MFDRPGCADRIARLGETLALLAAESAHDADGVLAAAEAVDPVREMQMRAFSAGEANGLQLAAQKVVELAQKVARGAI